MALVKSNFIKFIKDNPEGFTISIDGTLTPNKGFAVAPLKSTEYRIDAETINMDDIDVMMEEDHTNVIEITDKITLVMSYPTLASMGIIDNLEVPETDRIFQLIKSCIMEVHTGEDVINAVDVTEEELSEFIDSMTSDQLEKVSEFFATMPKVATMVKVKKGRKTHEVELSGLQSFFG